MVLLSFSPALKQNFVERVHLGDLGEKNLVLRFDEFVVEGGAVVLLQGFYEVSVILHLGIILFTYRCVC